MDEYSLALQALHEQLKKLDEFEIVGAFTTPESLLECLEDISVDILIADFMLQDNQGMSLLEKIHKVQEQQIKIIILLAGHFDKHLFQRGLELGVKAFLSKDTSFDDLVSVIRSVGKGNDVIPDSLVSGEHTKLLTDTEVKVLELVVLEYTNDRIAKELYLSRRTVETYVSNICSKLGVDSRIGAVREAVRLSLV
jgi:two-component system vancomycin resistance associated response regulator VraR